MRQASIGAQAPTAEWGHMVSEGVNYFQFWWMSTFPGIAIFTVVLATLDLANAILLLSGLSFLGLGAQPPQAEWGSMVADGTQYFQWWWMGTFPGLAIFTVVLAFNFLGDSLRDIFDPRVVGSDRRS